MSLKQGVAPAVHRIEHTRQAMDFEFLWEEIPRAITESLEGTCRVSEIVQAVRQFSHPGSRDREVMDVNQIVSNVVAVARNEWKNLAQVQLQLNPTLPRMYGYPAELGQALLNLIVNAAHAIRERQGKSGQTGMIEIGTAHFQHGIEIRIQDSGTGIASENLCRIFDPFFTTKAVGEGTGQGLAICHTVVVEKHAGLLQVSTKPGCGTTFVIQLPIVSESREERP